MKKELLFPVLLIIVIVAIGAASLSPVHRSSKISAKESKSWTPTRPNHSNETIQTRLKYYGQAVDYNGDGVFQKNEFKIDSVKIIMTLESCGNEIKSETPLIQAPPGFAFNPKTGEYDQVK